MPDLIDVLSESGLRTGEILPRAEIHRLGKYHRAIHLYLLNSKNEILLQRRALTVDHYPGLFGISVTGHLQAGESSFTCLRREIEEELGIKTASLQLDFLFSFFQEAILHETYIDRQFNDVYITHADLQPETIPFDRSEVSEVKFVPFDHFRQMVQSASPDLTPVYANECRDLIYFLNTNTLSHFYDYKKENLDEQTGKTTRDPTKAP
jgi:isopentenyl-diphosphate Delta-isomerase